MTASQTKNTLRGERVTPVPVVRVASGAATDAPRGVAIGCAILDADGVNAATSAVVETGVNAFTGVGATTRIVTGVSTRATLFENAAICRVADPVSDVSVPSTCCASYSVGQRSSGVFASIRSTSDSTARGISGRMPRNDGGASSMCARITAPRSPVKGRVPVSSSNAITPSAY